MGKYASKVVAQARAWLGLNESDGSHREIIDIYNLQAPLPRGYKMTLQDPWCAGFTTAVAVKLGYADIIPCECSCGKLIQQAKDMGIWVEDESVTPKPGWLALYDWQDTGSGDNQGEADHIGVVETAENGSITVIEGNYENAVKRRTIALNGKTLRGYIAPKYDAEPTQDALDFSLGFRQVQLGCTGEAVRAMQILLIGRGYSCGLYGANGVFGEETRDAVTRLQIAAGLTADGIAGPNTMAVLLGV